jgi:TIR domain
VNGEPPTQFPQSAEAVAATLTELFRHQKNHAACNVLENAKPRIEETGYDNWDGGIYLFTLFLDLPLKVFALIESDVPKLEKLVSGKLSTVLRNTGNLYLKTVAISPILENPSKVGGRKVAPVDVEHIWDGGYLRLFLSHVSEHKKNVAKLKSEFFQYGVSAFVAHQDIEPNAEWQVEIELALRSMDALVALLTPDFHKSNWTDQEVGFAMGSNVMVISVRLGLDPYGFIGKFQGLAGGFDAPDKLVSEVIDLLIKGKSTKAKMSESLVLALEKSKSFISANKVAAKLATVDYFTPEQLGRMEKTCGKNRYVKEAYVVPDKIKNILGRFKPDTNNEPNF